MSQTLVIGHIALIHESKKRWFTLELLKALQEKGYDIVGIFAGECREPDYMAQLERKVEDYGLKGQVTFLGRRNDIPDLLKMIDVLMIPSAFEGFPLAGLEAAAAGVPVAACDIAGAEEFIRVSGDGICFKEDDVEDALRAIAQILDHKKEMSARGKAFASRMTDAEYARNIKKQFENVA